MEGASEQVCFTTNYVFARMNNIFGVFLSYIIVVTLLLVGLFYLDKLYLNSGLWNTILNTVCKQKVQPTTVPVSVPVTVQPTVSSFTSEPEIFTNNFDENDREDFNNDLPNPNVALVEDGNDYSNTIQQMALDKSVLEQHNTYVNDRNKVTSTASFQPSRSDSQDVVPFVGLRRPKYTANDKDLVDDTARTVPSEMDSDHLGKPTQIYWQ
jgi:hypothetical protein